VPTIRLRGWGRAGSRGLYRIQSCCDWRRLPRFARPGRPGAGRARGILGVISGKGLALDGRIAGCRLRSFEKAASTCEFRVSTGPVYQRGYSGAERNPGSNKWAGVASDGVDCAVLDSFSKTESKEALIKYQPSPTVVLNAGIFAGGGARATLNQRPPKRWFIAVYGGRR
jgi:hypothetical protein